MNENVRDKTRSYNGYGWVVQPGHVEEAEVIGAEGGWVFAYAPAARIGSSGLNRLPICWRDKRAESLGRW